MQLYMSCLCGCFMSRTKQICMYSRLVLVYCTLDITSDATECVRETRAKNCGRERNIKKTCPMHYCQWRMSTRFVDNSAATSPDTSESSQSLVTTIVDSTKHAAVAATMRHKVNDVNVKSDADRSGSACKQSLPSAQANVQVGGQHPALSSSSCVNNTLIEESSGARARSKSLFEDTVDGLMAVSNNGQADVKPRSQSLATDSDPLSNNIPGYHVISKPANVTNHCMATSSSKCTQCTGTVANCECSNLSVSRAPIAQSVNTQSSEATSDNVTVVSGLVSSINSNPDQVVGSITDANTSSISSNKTAEPNNLSNQPSLNAQQQHNQQVVEYKEEVSSQPRVVDVHKILESVKDMESHATYTHTIGAAEIVHSDFKPVTIQRCTSWSPPVDAVSPRRQYVEEHRRRTTDSVPPNLADQLPDSTTDGHKSNTVLSAELAHIFGRKQSIPCGHHQTGTVADCEYCVSSSAASGHHCGGSVISNTPDHVSTTCESPSSHQSYSPSMMTSLNSSSNTEALSHLLTDVNIAGTPAHPHHNIVHPRAQYSQAATANAWSHLPRGSTHAEENSVFSAAKIARMVKHASCHRTSRGSLAAEINGQVFYCSLTPHFLHCALAKILFQFLTPLSP